MDYKDYKEKYNEALKRAKKFKEHLLEINDEGYVYEIDCMFPELKESEDERIRETLIGLFSNNGKKEWKNIPTEKIIAWLEKHEKQGKPNPYSGTSFDYNGHIWGMCARDNGVEILFDGELKAFLSLEKSFIYPIHPQPELAPKSALEATNEEMADNANKVEPKFEVDDWIICNETLVKIVDCDNNRYTVETTEGLRWAALIGTVDREFHLWTIADAKDGDVLVNGSNIFIFHFITDTRLMGYCHVNTNNGRFSNDVGKIECFGLIDAVVNPATKEQRARLFSKMKEAGYDWDEEKLELKEIANDNAEQDRLPSIWHDVTEELPPKREGFHLSEYVLVYDKYGVVYISTYDYSHKCWRYNNYFVTHWAYIPEPPKTE